MTRGAFLWSVRAFLPDFDQDTGFIENICPAADPDSACRGRIGIMLADCLGIEVIGLPADLFPSLLHDAVGIGVILVVIDVEPACSCHVDHMLAGSSSVEIIILSADLLETVDDHAVLVGIIDPAAGLDPAKGQCPAVMLIGRALIEVIGLPLIFWKPVTTCPLELA